MEELSDVDGPIIRSGEAQQCDKFSKLFYCQHRHPHHPDMEFVKNFTQPDFQAKNFTLQKRVNCDIFLANQQRKCIKY